MHRRLAVAGTAATVLAAALFLRHGIPRPADPRWPMVVVACVAVLVANDGVCALRWRLFMPLSVSRTEAVRQYSEAAFINTILPFAGDAWRARSGRAALGAVISDRAVGGAVVAVGAVVSCAVIGYRGAGVMAIAAAIVVAAALWLLLGHRLIPRLRLDPQRLAQAAALTVLFLLISAVAFAAAFSAARIDISVVDALAITPLVLLAAAVPSLSGVGPGLVVLGWAAVRAGADSGQTADVVVVLLLGQLAVAVLGALSLAARTRRLVPA